MDLTEDENFGTEDRAIDHVELEDGTLLVFDPDETEAWVECKSPIYLAGQN